MAKTPLASNRLGEDNSKSTSVHLSILTRPSVADLNAPRDREGEDSNESLVDDVLAIMTCYTAKASAKKSKLATEKTLSPEALREGYRLVHIEGWSVNSASVKLGELGFTTNRGDAPTEYCLRKELKANHEMLVALFNGKAPDNSFVRFCVSSQTLAAVRIEAASEGMA